MAKKTAEQWICDIEAEQTIRNVAMSKLSGAISDDVKTRRTSAGISQQRFAELMGTTAQRVSHLECGRAAWTQTAIRLAYAALERLGA